MAFSIRRLRWFLASAALLLIVVLAAFIGYGRYRALRIYRNLLHHAGATISHDTNGFTWSQTEKGRTIFTLHAKTATQLGEGQWSLHGVTVTLFGKDGKHTDYIDGNEFTYDEKEGLVKAIGEVHMDLQAPQSLTGGGHVSSKPDTPQPPQSQPPAESADIIHVRTSGLQYLRSLGVATTQEQVEFHYGGVQCTGQGAEFNVDESTLRLLANVVANGTLHGQPVAVHATSASVDRTANVATLTHAVAESKGETGSADTTYLDLRKDGSIESAKATGHVTLTGRTQKVTASQLDATFTAQTVPQTARLSGGVQLIDTNPLRPVSGSATVADIVFDAHGAPANLTATGAPRFMLIDKRILAVGLLREMHGDRIVATFVSAAKDAHTKSQLSDLRATGSAEAHGESIVTNPRPTPQQRPGAQFKTTTLTADDLDLVFSPSPQGNAEPQHLVALGHTLLQQDAPAGERESSAGDKLDAVFTQAAIHGKPQLALASALQTGHVTIHRTSPERATAKDASLRQQQIGAGTADLAGYDGATEKLTLSGNTHLTQDNATITATSVVLDDHTQDVDAVGNVQATLVNESTSASSKPAPFTHVLAASAHFAHDARLAEFHGTDAIPAKMWQEASQVQAANLLLDDAHRTFSARPASPGAMVHAVFAGTPATPTPASKTTTPASSAAAHSRYVRVAAPKLDYSEAQHEIAFTGAQGVVIDADAGTIRAQRAIAYLQPASSKSAPSTTSTSPFSSSLDHIVITGDVRLDQPGRHGTGDQLVYTAATGDSVLTGSPGHMPLIVDAQQGSITGPTLLFGDSGSTIVVSGDNSPNKPARVHTETHIEARDKEERH